MLLQKHFVILHLLVEFALMVILYFVLNTIQRIKKKFCFSHLPLRIMLLISILSWIFLQIYANDNFHTHGTIICLIYWLIGLALSKINLCLSKFHLAIGCLLLAISSIILRRYGFYDGVGMHRAYYFTTALLAVSIFCFFYMLILITRILLVGLAG